MFRRATRTQERHRFSLALARLLGDRSGTAAIEFAFTAVPFLLFVFGIFQIGLYHFSLQSLDNAVRTASRKVMTGTVQVAGLTAAKFKTEILCPALVVPLSCNNITVSVTTLPDLTNNTIAKYVNNAIPDLHPPNLDSSKGLFCGGAAGSYIFIDVAYRYPIISKLIKSLGVSDTNQDYMILRSTNFVYNELFLGTPITAAGC